MSGATPGAGDVTKGIPPQELATSTGTVPRDPSDVPPPPRGNVILKEILRGNAVTTILAIVLALIVGGILIAFTNEDVQAASVYFFAQPGDTFVAAWNAVYNGYEALFRGAIFNARGADFAAQIRPLTNTLGFAAPLIAAGLGVALAFRVGLFNIGARGQMLIGVAVAALLTFSLDLPIWLHIPVTLIAGIAGGALWGAIAGLIKARTGAHEVILTIMLNYIAYYLLLWMIRTPGLLQKPGTNQALGSATPQSAQFPTLLGPQFPLLDLGFVIVIVATLFVWWLIERSSLGMRMRAVGENPHAARAAGISVQRIYVYAMLFAGGLAGLAGMNQIQGAVTTGVTETIDAGIGFDAITVALLGRSRAWGTFAAGILFGALKAGSFSMQAQDIPVDIVLVVQSLVVLFIAAPPLLRTVFFLPKTDIEKAARLRAKASKKAVAA
ncbi:MULTISPECIES: ABC transporter permease [unclassified Microbacterium]|uniref:ABC transporter permease n=1 Tax=unclassified Microbacterium TaxID=2609290 RepID=UPI000CFDF331|nr:MULTISPECIES: ABC transporter permease [unclassified Microbacterium]PQZ56899.1 ABC transporter permease [Microbacterium sp. MYb43]PQZ79743.1 ABC transporter permease [Microbacterium sp. MYb40]PRB20156.1 ABC transporter permease [Microbacterium sp. MYb54]PRB27440.1 ABC transporter permease [Microbacterium sp. MYb50]PRB67335.1 ABC transporter permease [Microbacterium sp. MYb24]